MRNVLLPKCKHLWDISSIQLDGTHTPAKRGIETIDYQHEGKQFINITDPIDIPIAGKHHVNYNLPDEFKGILENIQSFQVTMPRLFFNADSGFDAIDFRNSCAQCDIFDREN